MPDTIARNAVAAVNEARQWDRLMDRAKLGAIPGDGVNRACLTDLDRQARRLLLGWGTAIGLAPSVDALGNLFLRRAGTDDSLAPVVTGSHMDTQPNGGRFDGIWGVIAGLEALEALHAAGTSTRRPIELVAWTNEEGGRFVPGCMGSMAFAGFKPADTWDGVTDNEGLTFGAELARHLALEADIPRRGLGVLEGPAPFAYLEAHIEQGPRLEAEGIDIGVVTGIQGSRWFLVEITGKTDHAGTTPLSLRRDAVQDMLRAVTALIDPASDDAATEAGMAAGLDLAIYFFGLVESKRYEPDDRLLSALIQVEAEGDRLSAEELIANTILLYAAGFETTSNLIGNGLRLLLTHPDQLERLRQDPSLLPSAILEMLRVDSPVQLNMRFALEPVELFGEEFPRGTAFVVLQASGNHDERVYEGAGEFDVARFAGTDAPQPLSFGWGAHHCLGAHLARAEGEIVFGELLSRFSELSIDTATLGDGPLRYRPS